MDLLFFSKKHSKLVFNKVSQLTIQHKILIIFFFALHFISCEKRNIVCEVPVSLSDSHVSIVFKDKVSGNYLYSEANPLYNKDSLRLYDENGNSLKILSQPDLIPNTYARYFVLSFGSIFNSQTDQSSFSSE